MNKHYLNSEFNIKNVFKKTFRKKISLLLVVSIVFLNVSALIVHAQMQSDEFTFGFNNDTIQYNTMDDSSGTIEVVGALEVGTTANDFPMSETASSAPATSTPAPSFPPDLPVTTMSLPQDFPVTTTSATASSAPTNTTSTPSAPISVTASSTPTTGSDDQVKRQIEELQKEIDKLKQELETSKNTRNNDQSGQSGQSGQNSSNGNSMMEDLMKMMMLGQLMQMLSGLQGGGGGGGFGGGDDFGGGDFGDGGDEFGSGEGTQNLNENGESWKGKGTEEDECVRLVNEFRQKYGRKPLKADERLTNAARQQSMAMARQGRWTGQHFIAARGVGRGENIAMNNTGSARSFVNQWINSPGHRANMLNNSYTSIGCGISGKYGTQRFS